VINYNSLGLTDDLDRTRFNKIIKTQVNDLYVKLILVKLQSFIDNEKNKKIRSAKEYLGDIFNHYVDNFKKRSRLYINKVVNSLDDYVSGNVVDYLQTYITNNITILTHNFQPSELIGNSLVG